MSLVIINRDTSCETKVFFGEFANTRDVNTFIFYVSRDVEWLESLIMPINKRNQKI